LTASTPISMINHSGYVHSTPRSPWRGSAGNPVVWRKSRKGGVLDVEMN
jgi:hypothetical protein